MAQSCGEVTGVSGLMQVSNRFAICDSKTDGGGWTLIASGASPPADYGGPWYANLMSLSPSFFGGFRRPHLWFEQRLSDPTSDIRFSCSDTPCDNPDTCQYLSDIVFYDTPWYFWIAKETHRVKRCFASERVHPKRCNLLTGECMEEWVADQREQVIGEFLCRDKWGGFDFHVDFNTGAASGARNKTDWGIVDDMWVCGNRTCAHNATHSECNWFAWVRGPRPMAAAGEGGGAEGGGGGGSFDIGGFGDGDTPGFLSDSIFYALGVIVAVTLPVFAYMCSSMLFMIADRVTADSMPGQSARARDPAAAPPPRVAFLPGNGGGGGAVGRHALEMT